MYLSGLDYAIIITYFIIVLGVGLWISKLSRNNLNQYFLGGNKINWYFLGLSNASGMFDISGGNVDGYLVICLWSKECVDSLVVAGLESDFCNDFLAVWIRRSNVMTGASWILTRFSGRGGFLSKNIIIIFAVISAIGFIAYFFEGIGKFCAAILPWDLGIQNQLITISTENVYALIIVGITTLYTIRGGMMSVVATEVFQYIIMTISSIAIAVIAFNAVSHAEIIQSVPRGWDELFFGWKMDLDWSGILPQLNEKIATDGFEWIGALFMMMLFKGFFSSLAGPVPGYDMQRLLSTRTPFEAAKMSGFTIAVLFSPRYLMIASFAVLAIVFLTPELASNPQIDFETILPTAIATFLPAGLKGLLLAGLMAAFMGTFAAVINAAPAYIANDLLKNSLLPGKTEKTYVRYGYLSSFLLVLIGVFFGFFATSLNAITLWITASLYGGYTAANVAEMGMVALQWLRLFLGVC